jgi:hypothetical protein
MTDFSLKPIAVPMVAGQMLANKSSEIYVGDQAQRGIHQDLFGEVSKI